MKITFRKLGVAFLALFMVLGLSQTGFGQNVILDEQFTVCTGTGGNDGAWNGNVASATWPVALTDAGWENVKGFAANSCIKLGTGSTKGIVTTPALSTLNGNATLTFKAGAWDSAKEQTELVLEITGGGSLDKSTVTMAKGAFTEFTAAITGGTATTKITFKGSQNNDSRFFLDDVRIVSEGGSEDYPIVTIAELKAKTPSEEAKYMIKNLTYIAAGDENIDPTAYMQDAEGNGLAANPINNPFETLTSGDVFDMVATWQDNGYGTVMAIPVEITKADKTAELIVANVTIETVTADKEKYNWRLVKINNVNYEYIQDELAGKITSGDKSFTVSEAFFEIPQDAKTDINISGVFTTSFGGTIAPRSLSDFEVNTNDSKIVVSETALAFGNVASATSKTMTFTVTPKNLTGDLAIAVAGEGFTVSPATIAQATTAATTVTVTFAPTAVQAYTGTITISGGGLATSSTVALTGNGITPLVPSIEVSETALAFGDVVIAATKPMTFTVTPRDLTGDLTIASTGEGFTVSPATIAQATTAVTTVTVTFAPVAVKAYTGTITISGGGIATSSTVTLTGNGVNKPEPSANLIVNGDFENWTGETLNDWTYTTADGASYAKETAIKEGGECSLKLMHTGTKGTAKLTATLVNVTAGEEYTLTMDYYMVSSNENVDKENGLRYWGTWKNGTASINEASGIAGWNSLQMGDEYLPAKPYGEWRRVNLTVTAPETATAMSMDIRWYNGVTCYVDNMSFKVAGETPTIDAPVATEATDITSNEFTANWNAVTGATSYLLTVSNDDGPVFTDKEVNGTSFNVTELNPDTEYSYSVKAKNAEAVSDRSNIISCVTKSVGVNDLESNTRIFANGKTINVELTEDATVTVFDINGRVVATSIGSSKVTVNTTGTYIVRVATVNNSIAKKLVIR